MNRRRALTLIGTVGLTGIAGCVGENGEINAVASPAEIPAEDRSGYQADGPTEILIDETIEAGGVSRDVNVTTWSSVYTSREDQASMFLISTPNAEFAGQSLNPLVRLSGADLITRVIDEGVGRVGGDLAVREIEQDGEITVTVLDAERTAPVFTAVVESGGGGGPAGIEGVENGEIPVQIYLLSITHGEDVLLAVGAHPQAVDASDEIMTLMEGIEHPVETANTNATSSETQ
jgi:hypothetical protein